MSESGTPGPGAKVPGAKGPGASGGFTHFDAQGRAVMVDVSDKPATHRTASSSPLPSPSSTTGW